jgi:membrane-anchored glycerophosphoryl diester phosphodiesterase (GDPDase)
VTHKPDVIHATQARWILPGFITGLLSGFLGNWWILGGAIIAIAIFTFPTKRGGLV